MSDGTCDVSIGEYDGDAASFYHETTPKARKTHTCIECRETIPIGARYTKSVGKWDGEFSTVRLCESCKEIGAEFSNGGSWAYGTIWDELETNWDDGAHLQACLNRLTSVSAKELLARKWRKWKGIEK